MFRKNLLLLSLFVFGAGLLMANTVQQVNTVDVPVALSEAVDYHVLSSETFGTSSIDLASTDAWLYLDSIRPSIFFEKYAKQVTINGDALDIEIDTVRYSSNTRYTLSYWANNARVHVYAHGTVIIPQDTSSYAALTIYTSENCEGEQLELKSLSRYRGLGDFDNKIASFRLKRGYMVTFAADSLGTGFSRVYIADTADVVVNKLPVGLADKVSAISIFDWQWPSKKGWCSSGGMAYNEIDLTESTWWYSWSADRPTLPNQEYVPIKQNGGWPSVSEIERRMNSTHLLGANEPDRPEQANMTVEQALNGWEALMATGLRLGSPAIADDLNWLYQFMEGCEERNYRVDFVAVHAYWGGTGGAYNVLGSNGRPDVGKWYNRLKEIHERTGHRPLWITEWNNGANWTNNGEKYWSSDPAVQLLQNDTIMKEILYMLDTCSFIERYSLYNWVSDRKMAVAPGSDGSQVLTPMGETYTYRYPAIAFNPTGEVIHEFEAVSPLLEAFCDRSFALRLNISDWNGAMTDSFVLERKIDTGEYEDILSGDSIPPVYYDSIVSTFFEFTKVSYRITLQVSGQEVSATSTTLEVGAVGGVSVIRPVKASFQKLTSQFFYMQHPYEEIPVVVTGGISNNSSKKVLPSISNMNKTFFNYQIKGWNYSPVTSLAYAETVSCMVAPYGNVQWGGLSAEGGKVEDLTNTWTPVTFTQTFNEIPVVFADVTTSTSNKPLIARVRNVTKTGFEVRLTCEDTGRLKGAINWLAIEQGSSDIIDWKITVGTIANVEQMSNAGQVDLVGYADPIFLAAIQTSNDENTYCVRYMQERGSTIMKVYKDVARRATDAQPDVIGYVIVEGAIAGHTSVPQVDGNKTSLSVYPTVTDGVLHVSGNILPADMVEVVDLNGSVVLRTIISNGALNVADLQQGIYLLRVAIGETARFIKK